MAATSRYNPHGYNPYGNPSYPVYRGGSRKTKMKFHPNMGNTLPQRF